MSTDKNYFKTIANEPKRQNFCFNNSNKSPYLCNPMLYSLDESALETVLS